MAAAIPIETEMAHSRKMEVEAADESKRTEEEYQNFLQNFSSMWKFSSGGDEDDDKGKGRKVPPGFEKFLKRTRRGIDHDKEGE